MYPSAVSGPVMRVISSEMTSGGFGIRLTVIIQRNNRIIVHKGIPIVTSSVVRIGRLFQNGFLGDVLSVESIRSIVQYTVHEIKLDIFFAPFASFAVKSFFNRKVRKDRKDLFHVV